MKQASILKIDLSNLTCRKHAVRFASSAKATSLKPASPINLAPTKSALLLKVAPEVRGRIANALLSGRKRCVVEVSVSRERRLSKIRTIFECCFAALDADDAATMEIEVYESCASQVNKDTFPELGRFTGLMVTVSYLVHAFIVRPKVRSEDSLCRVSYRASAFGGSGARQRAPRTDPCTAACIRAGLPSPPPRRRVDGSPSKVVSHSGQPARAQIRGYSPG